MVNPTPRILFITGTDTGVGKTVLTALLLGHLRQQGLHALAMKPFCSGDRADASLLHSIQDGELTLEEVNPFFFEEPVAPLVALRQHNLSIPLQEVLQRVSHAATRCERLLIEGSGGLLVPLGEGYSVCDLIAKLDCEVIVVSRNRLGTINHTLLTVGALQEAGLTRLTVVMMDQASSDHSTASNKLILGELLGQVPLHSLGFLDGNASRTEALKRAEKIFEKTLALILANLHAGQRSL